MERLKENRRRRRGDLSLLSPFSFSLVSSFLFRFSLVRFLYLSPTRFVFAFSCEQGAAVESWPRSAIPFQRRFGGTAAHAGRWCKRERRNKKGRANDRKMWREKAFSSPRFSSHRPFFLSLSFSFFLSPHSCFTPPASMLPPRWCSRAAPGRCPPDLPRGTPCPAASAAAFSS